MKIIKGYPPNYSEIIAALGKPAPNYMFTYGDTIYFPMGVPLPEDILAHEEVHMQQQTGWFKSPLKWWKRYLVDRRFRLTQEIEAYKVQWQFVEKHVRDRNMRHKMLMQMARDLSSPNYGNLVGFSEAKDLIIA